MSDAEPELRATGANAIGLVDAALPHLLAAGAGSIVTISSVPEI